MSLKRKIVELLTIKNQFRAEDYLYQLETTAEL